ncbi:MAG: tripartite tricarboxylate transporter substrate binding protein [Pusillimonas sp.]
MSTLTKSLPALLLSLMAFAPQASWANSFPDRPVTFLVPFPAGTATDVVARIVGERLGEKWGQSVIVDNRPGAGGNIGSEYASKAKPDGYTVLWSTVANSISATLYKNLQYDFVKDFDPVTLVTKMPLVLVANKAHEYDTLAQLVDYAKTHKGGLTFGSGGVGTSNHLAGEMLNSLTGIEMVHVPYKGTPNAYSDLIADRISIMFDNIVPAMAQIKSGSLKPLAVASLQRSPALPDVPTVDESGYPGFEAVSWLAMVVPAGTPEDVIKKINTDTVAVLSDPGIQEKLSVFGAQTDPGTPEQLEAFVDNEIKKWAKVINTANISIE